jgi:hypothetical protein
MRVVWLGALALALLAASSCTVGSRDLVTEGREVSGFDEVHFSTIGTLTISQGDTESLTIEAESNLMRRIRSEVRDGTLHIEMGRGVTIAPTRPVNYALTVKELKALDLAGLGSIYAGGLEVDDLQVVVSGAGKVVVRALQADSVTVSHTGVGQVELSGRAADQQATLTGAGDYDAAELESDTATVRVTGLGRATVWATESLDIQLTGAGSVRYYGSPRVTQNVTGLGQVRSLGEP